MSVRFEIVVVCLNPGEKLEATLGSIYSQDYRDYRVIIKDGGSTDGALEQLRASGYFDVDERMDRTIISVSPDKGIYDAMNQAVDIVKASEESDLFVQFLNCGDIFHDERVLSSVASCIEAGIREKGSTLGDCNGHNPRIFYGNQYNLLTGAAVTSSPQINEFSLYRNVPCHQVCFYDIELFSKRAYNTDYRVRADYEHFLYCMYEESAVAIYMNQLICDYEGGGFSETKANRKKSSAEHRTITDMYMGRKAVKYRVIMILSGAPLRTRLAESSRFSGIYNAIKSAVYGLKNTKQR